MKIKHESTIVLPYESSITDFLLAVEELKKVPDQKAKVYVSTSTRGYDQRDNSSYGGQTTIRVTWEVQV